MHNNDRNIMMAERGGFEPPTHFCEHAFQACALSLSAISPKKFLTLYLLPFITSVQDISFASRLNYHELCTYAMCPNFNYIILANY